MRLEIVHSAGRGVHLAPFGAAAAICMRPVLSRTGHEGGARTPRLCPACARALAAISREGRR